ncbi:MAG: hypothetical protein IJ264_05735 [Clostridia bacterium]|nr:hypothetical protein [Clostridia bacterium]
MFKVKLKTNPNITYTVYAVVPCGPTAYFLIFIDGKFELRHINHFYPAE